jgi:hypothetical protein
MHRLPGPLSLSFIVVVALLYSAIILGVTLANARVKDEPRPAVLGLRLAIGGWILLTGLLAVQGYFADFQAMPPRIAVASLLATIFFAVFAFSIPMARWLPQMPQAALIGLQSFRIIIEIQLYYLAQTVFMPTLMTIAGRNFDLLVGLSAPFVAYVVHRLGETRSYRLVVGWNLVSMLILVNTVVTGVLSAPTPMRLFIVEPPNTAIGIFPFAWLPTFVVPFALFIHLLSLRKAFRQARAHATPY